MSLFGDYAKWLGKRIIAGVVITGVGLAAWNWKHQGGENGALAAVHEEPERPKAEPQNCQSDSQRRPEKPSATSNLEPQDPGYDSFPSNIRRLSREDQRKRLYIYLPPNISREEAERW